MPGDPAGFRLRRGRGEEVQAAGQRAHGMQGAALAALAQNTAGGGPNDPPPPGAGGGGGEELKGGRPRLEGGKGDGGKLVENKAKVCGGRRRTLSQKTRLTRPEELRGFEWEGFALDESRSTDTHLMFTA